MSQPLSRRGMLGGLFASVAALLWRKPTASAQTPAEPLDPVFLPREQLGAAPAGYSGEDAKGWVRSDTERQTCWRKEGVDAAGKPVLYLVCHEHPSPEVRALLHRQQQDRRAGLSP
jgi:hypothetical protein